MHSSPATIKEKYAYAERGRSGIPTLSFRLPIDFLAFPPPVPPGLPGEYAAVRRRSGTRYAPPSNISPMVTQACLYLDYERGRKLGSFGPACSIVTIVVMPARGALIHHTDSMYTYTPRRESMKDSVRFILGNGGNERVDVTVILEVSSDATEY
jgi:hypothetical protein